MGDVRPFAQRVAEHLLVRAIAVECGDDRVLHRSGAAQASVRELLDSGEQIVEPRGCRHRHPAGAPSGREIRLRQRRERDDRRLGIERSEGAHRTIEIQVGVDLVGEQREVVLFREIDQRAAGFGRICRAGRVVRIDDDKRPRRRGDEAAHVFDVRLPAFRRIGPVEHGAGANLREHRRIEGISGYGNQHFVTRARHGGQCELDALGGAGGDHHPIRRHRHAALQALGRDRFAGRQDADRRRVAVVALAHRALDRFDHVRRRPKAERDRIADVQIPDLPPGRLDLTGLGDDVPDGIDETADPGVDANGSRGAGRHRRILSDRTRLCSFASDIGCARRGSLRSV